MKPKHGRFVVFEGLDGAGTTTQAKKLNDYLDSQGQNTYPTCEPTDEPVGKLIRDVLSGKVVSASTGESIQLSEDALCLLFAADRIEHSRVIDNVRADGKMVICDRYILSSIAYQSRDPSITPERVIEVNDGCSIPDVTFFLKVHVDDCLERLANRKDSPTVYEKKEHLTKISRNYDETLALYEKHFGPVVTIDGTQSIDKIHKEVVQWLEKASVR